MLAVFAVFAVSRLATLTPLTSLPPLRVTTSIRALRLRPLGGARKRFVSFSQFFVEHAQSAEIGKGLLGGRLVDFGEGKAHVDNRVVADFDFRHIVQADV